MKIANIETFLFSRASIQSKKTMPRPKINLGVGNTGLYRPIGNLPDINQTNQTR